MENIFSSFECEIDNLYYSTIEDKIIRYFNMGYSDNSNIPPQMEENSSGTYILIGTRKSGEFIVSNYKLNNGKFCLSVSLEGKLHKC